MELHAVARGGAARPDRASRSCSSIRTARAGIACSIERGLAALARAEALGGERGPVRAPGRDRRRATRGPPRPEDTDWARIAALYGELARAAAVARRRAQPRGRGRDGVRAGRRPRRSSTRSPRSRRSQGYHLLPSAARRPAREARAGSPRRARSSSARRHSPATRAIASSSSPAWRSWRRAPAPRDRAGPAGSGFLLAPDREDALRHGARKARRIFDGSTGRTEVSRGSPRVPRGQVRSGMAVAVEKDEAVEVETPVDPEALAQVRRARVVHEPVGWLLGPDRRREPARGPGRPRRQGGPPGRQAPRVPPGRRVHDRDPGRRDAGERRRPGVCPVPENQALAGASDRLAVRRGATGPRPARAGRPGELAARAGAR